MKSIDEARLETDLAYRYEFVKDFIHFGDEDVAAIRAVIGQFAPKIPGIVEATYVKLLGYDATARHFVPRQHGFEGEPPVSIDDLTEYHEQIQFRKEHLKRYLANLLGHSYDAKLASYLDMVGKMHTPKAGNKDIDVPLVQMNVLIGLLSDILIETIMNLDIERDTAIRAIRAFNKLLWIQNDMVVKHYAVPHH